MAFDGITIANLVYELKKTLLDTRITKIAQPENDELMLTCKGPGGQYRLSLSASASLPFVYLTDSNKPSPLQAPTFCMVLRKHIANGRIVGITQPHMERIIRFEIEHLNELGDICHKFLIAELMGKHSNLIFCSKDDMIIDSIKHVSSAMSSLREVLPGRKYFIPNTQDGKHNPLEITQAQSVADIISSKPATIAKALVGSFTGISPVIANEAAYRAGADADAPLASLDQDQLLHLCNHFVWLMDEVRQEHFSPVIIRKGNEPIEFASLALSQYADCETQKSGSISAVLESYYAEKAVYSRIRQKSADLRRIVNTALERSQKKFQLQQKQLADTKKREKYKIYGELIHVYGYNLSENARQLEAPNYYDDNKLIKIPLDDTLTPQENAQKYFDRYNKLKRTYEALTEQVRQTKTEIDHLESIQNALDIALSADDLVQIKDELIEYGYIKKGHGRKKQMSKSKPFHYLSTDGYDIYVGKNNYQNDELTFKAATGNDWWFHAKGMPGSHVIVKSRNEELPNRVFEEAGRLAGYYSRGRDGEKVEIDYLQKKNVKKPNGSAPGFVVYYTNYSLTIHPDITGIKLLES